MTFVFFKKHLKSKKFKALENRYIISFIWHSFRIYSEYINLNKAYNNGCQIFSNGVTLALSAFAGGCFYTPDLER